MSTSENAKVQIELSRAYNAMAAMTDSGDNQIFNITGGTVWSGTKIGDTDYSPVIRPNGVETGTTLVSPHATNDTLTIAGCTCYLAGVKTTVFADAAKTITRPAGAFAKICSVTITSAGVYAVVAGADAEDTTFIATRGGNGGPPYIPVTSIEIAQIKVIAQDAAAVAATEIYQDDDTHTERYDYPEFDSSPLGNGRHAVVAAQINAHIKFIEALDTRHTADVPKGVYIQYYEPSLSEQSKAFDFVPVENTASTSSQQVYQRTVGSTSKSMGTGGFTALLNDGINDGLVTNKDRILTVKFFPNKDKPAYNLTQGTISLKRTFPVANQNQATVTIAAESISSDFSS